MPNGNQLLYDYFKEKEDASFDWVDFLVNGVVKETILLTTKQFVNSLSGDVRKEIEEIVNQQKEYGNDDIFDVRIIDKTIAIYCGDYWLTLFFDENGNIIDRLGTMQGHIYQAKLERAAEQLFNLVKNA